MPIGLIPVVISPQVSVDNGCSEKSSSHFPELGLNTELTEPSELEYSLALSTLSEGKPSPPEVSLILTSGLQIKCDIGLLSQVLEVVEHV